MGRLRTKSNFARNAPVVLLLPSDSSSICTTIFDGVTTGAAAASTSVATTICTDDDDDVVPSAEALTLLVRVSVWPLDAKEAAGVVAGRVASGASDNGFVVEVAVVLVPVDSGDTAAAALVTSGALPVEAAEFTMAADDGTRALALEEKSVDATGVVDGAALAAVDFAADGIATSDDDEFENDGPCAAAAGDCTPL